MIFPDEHDWHASEQPDPRPRRILTALLIGFVAASVMGVWLVNN